jgi:hypothetical protein
MVILLRYRQMYELLIIYQGILLMDQVLFNFMLLLIVVKYVHNYDYHLISCSQNYKFIF